MIRKNPKLKGFTLIEIMVAMFAFTLIITASSQIFTRAFAGYRNTKYIQRDIENAQFILNSIAKELRTSSIVNPASGGPTTVTSVKFYDPSQGICFNYRITGGNLEVPKANSTGVSDCRSLSLGGYSVVSTGTVTGDFYVRPSDDSPLVVGKITIALQVREGSAHTATIQTTASLRDYGNVGL